MSPVTDRAPFRGPYADGPPPEALHVDPPSLRTFGFAELRRFFTIGGVMTLCVVRALVRRFRHLRRQSWAAAAAEGVVDGLLALGPMFIKLGQLLGFSPSICRAVLSDAARRCIREVDPVDVDTVKAAIEANLGRPAASCSRPSRNTRCRRRRWPRSTAASCPTGAWPW